MKLRSIYNQIVETNEKKYTSGKKRITIEVYDGEGEFEKLLNWWKSMGDIGHSAVVHCDVGQPGEIVKIFCDGDGADRVQSIQVEKLEEENY